MFERISTNPNYFLPCLGLSIPQAWIFWINSTTSAYEPIVPWQSIYAIISIVLFAAATTLAKRSIDSKMSALRKTATISGTLGSILLVVSNAKDEPIMALCSLVICGFALSLLYIQWGLFYSRIELRYAILLLFITGIVAAAIKTAVFFAPWSIGSILCIAFPGISSALSKKASLTQPPSSNPAILFSKQSMAGLWKAAGAVIAFSMASAVLLATTLPPKETDSILFLANRLTEALLCAGVLVLVFPLRKIFDFPQLWKIILVITATGLLSCMISHQTVLQNVLADASVNFIVLFVWLSLSDIARHSSLSPIFVFGIGWCCWTFPFFLGSIMSIVSKGLATQSILLALALYIVSIASAFCLERRDRDIALVFSDLKDRPAEPSDFDNIDKRCTAAAEHYSLTKRELEVMQHLCKGRSKAYIAEALFVTENTVKGHTKRLYAKLNIHSRKELQQLIDLY